MAHSAEIKRAVETAVILVDTREQTNGKLVERLTSLGHPYRREALKSADYMVEYQTADGSTARLPVAIERKMSLDELASCLTAQRERFQRELERLKADGIKTYLLVEKASWEDIYNGKYRSRMSPASFIGSLIWWAVHYDLRIIFCKVGTSGRLIGDILKYEVCEEVRRNLHEP